MYKWEEDIINLIQIPSGHTYIKSKDYLIVECEKQNDKGDMPSIMYCFNCVVLSDISKEKLERLCFIGGLHYSVNRSKNAIKKFSWMVVVICISVDDVERLIKVLNNIYGSWVYDKEYVRSYFG